MKRIIIVAALLLTSIGMFAQNGRSFYQKYSDEPGVSAVYISPAMFRMMGSIPEISAGDNDVNLAPIIRNLKGMYIINSENVSLNGKGNDILVNPSISVSVYASKDGYDNSDVTTKDILLSSTGMNLDANGDGVINAADIVTIVNMIMSSK